MTHKSRLKRLEAKRPGPEQPKPSPYAEERKARRLAALEKAIDETVKVNPSYLPDLNSWLAEMPEGTVERITAGETIPGADEWLKRMPKLDKLAMNNYYREIAGLPPKKITPNYAELWGDGRARLMENNNGSCRMVPVSEIPAGYEIRELRK